MLPESQRQHAGCLKVSGLDLVFCFCAPGCCTALHGIAVVSNDMLMDMMLTFGTQKPVVSISWLNNVLCPKQNIMHYHQLSVLFPRTLHSKCVE